MPNKNHISEFEKHANTYNSFAPIQQYIAKELVHHIDFEPKTILDLGCGTGEIYKNISWKIDKFFGVDYSPSMCNLHPKDEKVNIFCDDFESVDFKNKAKALSPFDLVMSSSSLQWATNLQEMFDFCSNISDRVAFSIFTRGTFKTIYKMTQRESFLPTCEEVKNFSKVFKNPKIIKKIYKLDFIDNISKFRYIKNSGISGGNAILNYKKMKYLLENYPYSYLEFEVIFITN